MRLRTLLALLFSGLLILTAGSIGWLGYSSSHRAAKRSTQKEIAMANATATHHVVDFLNDPANRLLSELTLRARRGMLSLKDDRSLGFDLAERLRVNPTLAWISYSDAATGHFVGVWRDPDRDIVLNVETPGQGEANEEIIRADGSTAPYNRTRPQEYDPRTRDWFKNAVQSDTTVWSPPYLFADGVKGVTASRAWRTIDGEHPAGVFTVDFYLKDLEGLLDDVARNIDANDGFSAIMAPDGSLICASQQSNATALTATLAAWVKANPAFKDVSGSHLIPLAANGTEYLAALKHIDAPSGLKCIVAGMVPSANVYQTIDRATGQMGEVALAALVLALLVGSFIAYRISAPLHALGDDLANVGRLQLAGGNQPRSVVHEVNQLHDAADRMKSGLRSFIKYVPDDLVRRLLSSGQEATLGGEMRRLTLFFSDIEGFTSYSEKVAPDVLTLELAEYFEVLSQKVRQNSGTIDKFIGDGLLAFFNAPENVPNHESLACRAALEALEEMTRHPLTAGFRTRVGLHAGDIHVGNFGTKERFAYTVLGDPVNVASRLENLNKIYGTQVLASRDVREPAGNDFEWRHLDRVAVAGRQGGLDLYELIGLKNAIGDERHREAIRYEEALEFYFARNFRAAQKLFTELARQAPADKAAALMASRCNRFFAMQLPADWNGVFSYEIK